MLHNCNVLNYISLPLVHLQNTVNKCQYLKQQNLTGGSVMSMVLTAQLWAEEYHSKSKHRSNKCRHRKQRPKHTCSPNPQLTASLNPMLKIIPCPWLYLLASPNSKDLNHPVTLRHVSLVQCTTLCNWNYCTWIRGAASSHTSIGCGWMLKITSGGEQLVRKWPPPYVVRF